MWGNVNIVIAGDGDDDDDDDDDGLPANSHRDKIPPTCGNMLVMNIMRFCHQHIPTIDNDDDDVKNL